MSEIESSVLLCVVRVVCTNGSEEGSIGLSFSGVLVSGWAAALHGLSGP